MGGADRSPLGIVVSRADRVAERIADQLLARREWTRREDGSRPAAEGGGEYYRTTGAVLRTVDAAHLHLEHPERAFDADLERIVFPSRHAGETGPLLTTHFTGNVGRADHGGADRDLATAAPIAGKRALRVLDAHAPTGYDVSMECTHHGPSAVDVPSLFLELGSGDEQWSDREAAGAVARAVLACRPRHATTPKEGWDSGGGDGAPAETALGDATSGPRPLPGHRLVGIGGGHYAPRFTRIDRETSWAVGHVAADWGIAEWSAPDPDVIDQLFERSDASIALLAGDALDIEDRIDALGYRVVDETWIRATSGIALDLVRDSERRLSSVEDGLRFGRPARMRSRAALERSSGPGFDAGTLLPDSASRVALPPDLLDAAAGVDLERTRAAVADRSLAFETTAGGSRPSGRAVVGAPQVSTGVIDALARVLESKYDVVERTGGAIVAERRVFDPDRAARLGVPEGPAFGRLAAGETVTVDGREIEPEAVTVTERDTFDCSTGAPDSRR